MGCLPPVLPRRRQTTRPPPPRRPAHTHGTAPSHGGRPTAAQMTRPELILGNSTSGLVIACDWRVDVTSCRCARARRGPLSHAGALAATRT
jgi:hypothetical protein